MKPEYEILLIQLPKIPNHDKEYFGVGYFSENGDFVFSLLTQDMMKNFPLRIIQSEDWKKGEYNSEHAKILGKINALP